MRIDMRIDMCIDMCIDDCIDTRLDMCVGAPMSADQLGQLREKVKDGIKIEEAKRTHEAENKADNVSPPAHRLGRQSTG